MTGLRDLQRQWRRQRRIDDASKGSKTTPEAEAARQRAQCIVVNDGGVREVRGDRGLDDDDRASAEDKEETTFPMDQNQRQRRDDGLKTRSLEKEDGPEELTRITEALAEAGTTQPL